MEEIIEIVGESPAMRRAMELVDRFGPTAMSVLLIGPTGTGKELLARRLHQISGRRGGFIDVNCAALPRDLAEAELFGHTRGAYTGAASSTEGLIRAADGGTLFLDELTSLPLETQGKLLRVLESRQVRRVGETTSRTVNFRLVAAAHLDVHPMVREGRFREDLLHRVAGVQIYLPPLSSRPEDTEPAARLFAMMAGKTLSDGAMAAIMSHGWPGNVRELRSAVDRAAILSNTDRIGGLTMQEAIGLGNDGGGPSTLPAAMGREPAAVRAWLFGVCAENGWRADSIARALGVHRSTLFRWLRHCRLSLRRIPVLGRVQRTSSALSSQSPSKPSCV